jgi:hypothetical protein
MAFCESVSAHSISRGRDDVRARSGQRWATDREACRRSGVVGCDITGPPPNRRADLGQAEATDQLALLGEAQEHTYRLAMRGRAGAHARARHSAPITSMTLASTEVLEGGFGAIARMRSTN